MVYGNVDGIFLCVCIKFGLFLSGILFDGNDNDYSYRWKWRSIYGFVRDFIGCC